MKSDDKKRSYEETQYDKGSLSKDYFELLQSILGQLTADALNGVPIPPNTAARDVPWDGRYFWNFVSNLQKDDKEDFENLLNENGASFGTLNKMPYQGATVDNAEIAICTSAQLLEISLKEYIESYIVRCKRRKYDIKGFKGHDETIRSILRKYSIDNIEENESDFEKEEDSGDITGNNPSQNTAASVSSSQSIQPQLTFPKAKEDNANYYANSLVRVFGRDHQKARLSQFLTCHLNVAWFQLAGDAGQGKSRLAFDLLCEASNAGWHAGFLTEYDIKSFEDHWKDWRPDASHLFIFDYVVGREQKIKPILQTLVYNQDKFKHRIRILLIERQRWDRGSVIKAQDQRTQDELGTSAHSDKAEWFLKLCEEEDFEGGYLKSCRFDNGVEELKGLDHGDLVTIIKQLMIRVSGKALTLTDGVLKKILVRIDDSGRPLYAYLLAQQLNDTQEGYQSWTKFDLLDFQLKRDKRRWQQAFKGEVPTWGDSHLAMKLAVLATIVRELNFQSDPIKKYFGNIESHLRREAVAITSGYLINNDRRPLEIHSLEPDLLGEWFVLYCFHQGMEFEELIDIAWQCSSINTAIFLQRITQDFIDANGNKNIIEKLLAHPLPDENYYQALANVAVGIGTRLYGNNLTISRNIIVALEHAANSLNINAMNTLGVLYLSKLSVTRNPEKAVGMYQRAIQHGDIDALVSLGYLYQHGLAGETNLKKAAELYQRAVEQDNGFANYFLGRLYHHGLGVKKDWKKAITLYRSGFGPLGENEIQDILFENFLGKYKPQKNNGWPNNKLPHLVRTPVFDPPILSGDWKQLTAEQVRRCLDKAIASFELLDLLKNLEGYFGQYGRCLTLSFYRNAYLVDIQLYDPLAKNILIFSAVTSPDSALLLDGGGGALLSLNRFLLLFDSTKSVVDYLQFFCSYSNEEGKIFQIISDVNEIPFDKEVDQHIQETKMSFFSPRCIEGSFEREGWQKIELCVLCGNAFYDSTFKVFSDGRFFLEEQAKHFYYEISVRQRQYSYVFRTPLQYLDINSQDSVVSDC